MLVLASGEHDQLFDGVTNHARALLGGLRERLELLSELVERAGSEAGGIGGSFGFGSGEESGVVSRFVI